MIQVLRMYGSPLKWNKQTSDDKLQKVPIKLSRTTDFGVLFAVNAPHIFILLFLTTVQYGQLLH